MTIKKLENGLSFEGTYPEGIFESTIVETIDQEDLVNKSKEVSKLLGFTDTTLLWPDQKFSTKVPGLSLKEVGEKGKAPERKFWYGPNKWVYQKIYSEKVTSTDLFLDWARTANTIKGAPMGVQAEMIDIAGQTKDLVEGSDRTEAEVMTKVLTLWETATAANGPASLTPKGKALFATDHTVEETGGTFSNIKTGAFTDTATRTTILKEAIDQIRGFRFDNGQKVLGVSGNAMPFYLIVPTEQMGSWMEVLNNYSEMSGQGANSKQENYFLFEGFKVMLKELPLLGDYDADGIQIGNTTACYLLNPNYLMKSKALRHYSLSDKKVKVFEENDPEAMVTIVRNKFGADHYGAEYWIVKLTWEA